MAVVSLDHQVPLTQQNAGQNDCGPHAAAMTLGFYDPQLCDPEEIAHLIRFRRIPALGATLPWGVSYALHRHGLNISGGMFGSLSTIKAEIALNRPVVVIVHPTDFACPWYALHYRVVVGFCDDSSVPGGGTLYFNCSARPPQVFDGALGNVALSYAAFLRQWRTYLTYRWALSAAP